MNKDQKHTIRLFCLSFVLGSAFTLAACSDEKPADNVTAPEVEVESKPDLAALKAEAAKSIQADNADEIAAALEKEILEDLD